MKKILIIAPHFPPSNLAAIHRSRLFAQHLPEFGWEPVILTIHENFYEEKLDWNLTQLLPKGLRIEKVFAYPLTKPRLIGDLGLRGYFQLRKRALELIREEKFDFVYIPIPSFYAALLGPSIHNQTGVKYGIDYIDPWVHHFPGSEQVFSRHWWSTKLANWLEPKAIRQASIITGVAEGYYKGVLDRNPQLHQTCLFGAMPYGGEANDHVQVKKMSLKPYLFAKTPGKLQFVYAGAMLPKAYAPLEAIFKAMAKEPEKFANLEFHFIGTGKRVNDPESYNIRPLAEKYGLWQQIIFEYPQRIPYLDVLVHLEVADAVFILGSTEPHYTPSKVYQGVLSGKPIFAILHSKSSAVEVLRDSNAGKVLDFDGQNEVDVIESTFNNAFADFKTFYQAFNPKQVNQAVFDMYSARHVTSELAQILDAAVQ